jgi:hypothetical protein
VTEPACHFSNLYQQTNHMSPLTIIHTAAELLPWTILLLGIYGLWPLLILLARVACLVRRVLA